MFYATLITMSRKYFSVFFETSFWIENFQSQNILKVFLEILLLFMFHATLIIMSKKYFFRFSKFATTLRYTILDSRFPPENAISEGRPTLCNSS